MPNKFDSNGMIHQWIYVIIPVQKSYTTRYDNAQQQTTPETYPLFCAFCKGCRTYFTEPIECSDWKVVTTPSSLPRFGCVLPDDVPVV